MSTLTRTIEIECEPVGGSPTYFVRISRPGETFDSTRTAFGFEAALSLVVAEFRRAFAAGEIQIPPPAI